MKLSSLKTITVFLVALIISSSAYSAGQEFNSATVDQLDEALKTEFSPCSPEKNQNKTEQDTTITSVILSSDIDLTEGEMIKSSGGGQAIVDSYDSKTKILKYHQTADTGFMLLSIGEIITDSNSTASIIIGIPKEKIVPCFERIVSIDEDAREMIYISLASLNDVLLKLQTLLDKQRDKATSSLALLQEKLIQEELAAFEAQLEAELAAQQMMAEMIAEEVLTKRLAEFQAKLEAEKAAAAASTAAYQSKIAYESKVNKIMEDLARELELAKELGEFESQLAEELVEQATARLEEEIVVGAISGEIVTVAGHKSCKDTLNLSSQNIVLFKLSLSGDYLYNVGPINQFGTEFSANRWDKYISCIGSYNE
jgi:hypothetical protein